MKTFYAVALALPLALIPNCKKTSDPMTLAEAQQAFDESQLSSQALSLTSSSVEISTHFTLGDAVEQAAEQLRTFIESQLPCADVQVSLGKLDVTYGAKPGSCTYQGHTYSGSHSITVQRTAPGEAQVEHSWEALSNGVVTVTGTAQVNWSLSEGERRVQHELTWTRLSDGRQGVGSGDITQQVLEGGLVEGIQLNGARDWTGERGRWDLAIESVEMRWVDAVPQAGRYVMRTPKGKSASLGFQRTGPTRITVTVASGERSFDFDVVTLPSE